MHTHISAVHAVTTALEVLLVFTVLKLVAINLAKQPGVIGAEGRALGWQVG